MKINKKTNKKTNKQTNKTGTILAWLEKILNFNIFSLRHLALPSACSEEQITYNIFYVQDKLVKAKLPPDEDLKILTELVNEWTLCYTHNTAVLQPSIIHVNARH